MNVLVIGKNSYIGNHIDKWLTNKGHKVEPKKKGKEEDPEVSEVVERFVSATGSRCEIKGTLDRGKLLIKFRSQQDLERIYSLLSGGSQLFD